MMTYRPKHIQLFPLDPLEVSPLTGPSQAHSYPLRVSCILLKNEKEIMIQNDREGQSQI